MAMGRFTVDVVVEIPRGSQNKYEFDPTVGAMRLKKVLFSPMHYPTEYGYVNNTLAEDGDPVDVLVLSTAPTFPGCVIETRIIGVLIMTDDKGPDDKLLGVPAADPRFSHIASLADVPEHLLKEIAHFFQTYKSLEAKTTLVEGWKDADEAERILNEAIARLKK